MREVLDPYIKSGKVVYTFFPGKAMQIPAYNDALKKYKYKTKYMAFIDVNEFLLPEKEDDSLDDIVERIISSDDKAAGLAVNWRVYGSSNFENRPEGLVSENFTHRGDYQAPGNDVIKTIANPRFIVEYRHPHYPKYVSG